MATLEQQRNKRRRICEDGASPSISPQNDGAFNINQEGSCFSGNPKLGDHSSLHQGNNINIHVGTKSGLHALRLTDPRTDKTRIEETKGGLLKECYRWILDDQNYLQWRDDQESRLLWIKGDPGKGKTMLLCGVIDELIAARPKTSEPAYFFCQATERSLNNATAVLRGLLYMLVLQHPHLKSRIQNEYEDAGDKLFEGENAWFEMSRILTEVLNDPFLEGKILMIDALDECLTGQHQLLHFISKSSSRAKWAVSSRNSPAIEDSFQRAAKEAKVYLGKVYLELNTASIRAAVRTYVDCKVGRLVSSHGYDKQMRDAIRSYLTLNAEDTFLWVALVCDMLERLSPAASNLTQDTTLDRLKEFPPGLDAVYERMMVYVNESTYPEYAKHMLRLVSVVYRPTTLQELAVLHKPWAKYAQDIKSLEEILNCCGSFLTLREGIVNFVHQSAKDFLLNREEDFRSFSITQQHHAIFSRSLKVLSKELKRDIYGLHDIYKLRAWGVSIDDISPPEPDPLVPVKYCCTYWVDHLHDSNATETFAQGLGKVHKFLESKYLYWLEALSLLRSMPHAVRAIQKLKTLVSQGGVGTQQLWELIDDADLFTHFCQDITEVVPLQLYASALCFSPTGSLIRNCFSGETPTWIKTIPAMPAYWHDLQMLKGHNRSITSVTFSADGQWLASGSYDGSVKVWVAATGASLYTLEGHGSPVLSVAFSADGQQLAWGLHNGMVKVWDISAFSVYGHQLASMPSPQTLEDHSGSVLAVAFSADGQWLASGSDDGLVKVWVVATGASLYTLEGHGGPVLSVAFSADGQQLAWGLHNGTVKVWDVAVSTSLQTLEGYGHPVSSVDFSSYGQRLASGSGYNTVNVWDVVTGTSLQPLSAGIPLNRISFDARNSIRLSTDIGVLTWHALALAGTHPVSATTEEPHYHGYGMGHNNVWITKDRSRLLWLPQAYRPWASIVNGSTIALGCASGGVLCIQFSADVLDM